jgi:hypothetical protein
VHSFVSKTNYIRTNNVSTLATTGLGSKESFSLSIVTQSIEVHSATCANYLKSQMIQVGLFSPLITSQHSDPHSNLVTVYCYRRYKYCLTLGNGTDRMPRNVGSIMREIPRERRCPFWDSTRVPSVHDAKSRLLHTHFDTTKHKRARAHARTHAQQRNKVQRKVIFWQSIRKTIKGNNAFQVWGLNNIADEWKN